ncbi:MAG: flagellar protein FlbB [Treponema sp.]|jgi:flagellar protein FlbB|nr:flagellar protein FlbB [Treponema sp.]
MTEYGEKRVLGRVIVLLLLIIAMVGGGLVWFDYLNVIDAKTLFAPLYNKFIDVVGRTQPLSGADEPLSLDRERLLVREEALNLQKLEVEKQEQDIKTRLAELEQIKQELEERQKALDDRENSINALIIATEDKSRNVEQNARYLAGMPPVNAVGILAALDDQDAIDVLRKTEEIAQAEGTTSIVSYWLSLMAPERAAELQRKMAARPSSLNLN